GATGSTATITIASIARTVSVSTSFIVTSAFVVVDRDRPGGNGFEAAGPPHVDLAELAFLFEFDPSLLEQLQHGEEPHDHLEALDQTAGEAPERDASDPGQLVDQLRPRVSDAGPPTSNVEEVDSRHRPRRDGPQTGSLYALGGGALQQVRHHPV